MTDFFYEYADEVGMMIWQDMMFSCLFYPFMDEKYNENGAIEVRYQAGRLQHHASIVYWVLNNEGQDMFHWSNGNEWNATTSAQYNNMYLKYLTPAINEAGINISNNFQVSSPSTDTHRYYYA